MCVCADDPQADKLLLVMEYAEAGPVMRGDRSTEKVPLAEGVALKFFRDVVQVGWCQFVHLESPASNSCRALLKHARLIRARAIPKQ